MTPKKRRLPGSHNHDFRRNDIGSCNGSVLLLALICGIGQSMALLSGTSMIDGNSGLRLRGCAAVQFASSGEMFLKMHATKRKELYDNFSGRHRNGTCKMIGIRTSQALHSHHLYHYKKSTSILSAKPNGDRGGFDKQNDDEAEDYLNNVARGDDASSSEYLDKMIAQALEEENSMEIPATQQKQSSSHDGNSSLTTLEETKKMIEQQQQQINLLMKLVQSRQPLPTNTERKTTSKKQRFQASQATVTQQKAINVAPLKAMLFIDGTWLYYSLNTRDSGRDPVLRKFGRGWQNYYKVDWRVLPKLICHQIEKQRNSKITFAGSERPIEVARAMVFTSAKKDTDPNSIRMRMFREMSNANYDVHMMETIGQGEKCVDIQLAVEMLHYATVPNAYDVAILLSGDKDFVPALVRTRQKGKQLCIASMKIGCNRVLYESPHIRDYDVVWLEELLDELIIPIPQDELSRRDRAGYVSVFTMMRVLRDFVGSAPDRKWVNSRDIGKYLKSIKISDSNMLEELKQCHSGLRTFLMERACNLFDVKFPGGKSGRGPDDHSFWVRVKGDTSKILIDEFKRTQFFTKEEKEFLEDYKVDKYINDASYIKTEVASEEIKSVPQNTVEGDDYDNFIDISDLEDLDNKDGNDSPPAMNFGQLTVASLKELCREKGLKVSGKKDELIERLEGDRRLEHEIIQKQRMQAKESSSRARQRSAAQRISSNTTPIVDTMQTVNNIYAAALPQMDASRHSRSADTGLSAHLENLIKEYLRASGGKASSRDVGRYLAANGASRRGSKSALTELKEAYGSLLSFLRLRANLFAVLDEEGYGGHYGFEIKLKDK